MPTISAEPMVPWMPETTCPKLRRVRELLLEEQVANMRDQRLERQQDAVEKWRNTPAKGGHEAFFQLAVDLRSGGMTVPEIETTLWQEVGHARHPTERRSQIKSIMRTLSHGIGRAAA